MDQQAREQAFISALTTELLRQVQRIRGYYRTLVPSRTRRP